MRLCSIILCIYALIYAQASLSETAFTINGKATAMSEVAEAEKQQFYDIEIKRYRLIEQMAHQRYLDYFWQERASKSKKSIAKEQNDYFDAKIKVEKKDIDRMLKELGDHPQLSKLSDKEKQERIRSYIEGEQKQRLTQQIIEEGKKSKKLIVNYPKPVEPRFEVKIKANDPVRYGPKSTDTSPIGCKDEACVTIVEYSEYQCPFCARVIPTVNRLLTEYKGKIRWVVRDYPLSFHDRAKPAAVAAHCAMKQGKFWEMYNMLFQNQKALSDKDFASYADKIKIDKKKWADCVAKPGKINQDIEDNFRSGVKFGVTGTPAFFINGRKLSGALPYESFKQVIDEELATNSKKQAVDKKK